MNIHKSIKLHVHNPVHVVYDDAECAFNVAGQLYGTLDEIPANVMYRIVSFVDERGQKWTYQRHVFTADDEDHQRSLTYREFVNSAGDLTYHKMRN